MDACWRTCAAYQQGGEEACRGCPQDPTASFPPYMHMVQAQLEAAAEAIMDLRPGPRCAWALYFYEALDNVAQGRGEDAGPLLAALKERLGTRLDRGQW